MMNVLSWFCYRLLIKTLRQLTSRVYFNQGLLYLTVASYEEAVLKEEKSVKELKEKFEAKILENKVSVWSRYYKHNS
jgi:hypothetical protein